MSRTDENATEIGAFVDTIWGNTEGYVYLPTREYKSNSWKKVFFEWPKHRDHVIRHVMANSAKGLDVYAAPAIFRKPNPAGEFVKGSQVIWCDYDGSVPTWDTGQKENGSEQPAQPTTDGIPAPNLRIQSSSDGHEHCYWILDEFTTDLDWIEAANRSIAYTSKADTSGWDRNQILRPPGSINYKHDLPVTIINNNGGHYDRSSFKELKPPAVLVSDSIDIDNLPNVNKVIAKYRWEDNEYDLFCKDEIPEGERSFALMRVGYAGAEMGMLDNEIYALLVDADNRWKKYVNRDDRKKRLLNIIDRARQKHPVGNDELTFRGLLESTSIHDEVEVNTQLLYGFNDFLESEIEVEWLIEDLLEVGGFGMVAGKPGVGKTQWSIQLAIAAALGIDFLGWRVVRPLKVAFLSLEMSHSALKRFLSTISTGYEDEQRSILQDNFTVVPLGESLILSSKPALNFFESLLNDIQPDLIIIDSYNKLLKKFDDETVLELNRTLIRIRKKYGTAFWFIHHNRKENGDNRKPTELDDVYGSVYITSEQSCVIVLWRDKNGDKNIIANIPVKTRLAEERDEFMTIRDHNTLKFILATTFEPANLNVGEKNAVDSDAFPMV